MRPWGEIENLLKVYQLVFSLKTETIESLEWAKNQLLLWQIKDNYFEFNVEIDATLSLFSALIQDQKLKHQPNCGLSNLDLQSFYSIAIVKFCNILPYYKVCNPNQIKRVLSKLKRSSNETGRALNLPDWLIECRHNICHSHGISLILLRQANYLALSWLNKHFWSKLVKNELAHNQENLVNLNKILNQLVVCKIPKRRKYLYRVINRQLHNNQFKTFNIIASLLVEINLNEIDFKNCKISYRTLIKFQRVLIISTINYNILLLFDVLADYLKDSNQTKVQIAAIWLITFIKGFIPDNSSSKLFRILRHNYEKNNSEYSKILWLRLLYKVCQNLNQYTFKIISLIEQKFPNILPSHYIEALKNVSYTITNFKELKNHSMSFKHDTIIKTVEDLKAMEIKINLIKANNNCCEKNNFE